VRNLRGEGEKKRTDK
jgi:hypothetical protein